VRGPGTDRRRPIAAAALVTAGAIALASLTGGGVAVAAGSTTGVTTAGTTAADGGGADPSQPPPTGPGRTPVLQADGVRVGDGSYAPTPPSEITDYDAVQKTLGQDLHIDPSQAGKPVPTNQWWTDLINQPFSGNLWANPLVSSNAASGTTVSYPNDWTSDGSKMQVEDGIKVSAAVDAAPDASDHVLADFEHGIPSDWTTTGTAFSTSSSVGKGQSAADGWLGTGYLTSWSPKNGDGASGTATSPTFTIDRSSLTFLVAAGRLPGKEDVQLVVDGKVVQTTSGKENETLDWVKWDVSAWSGQAAQIRVVDSTYEGWGHVMADQFMLTDHPDEVAGRYSTTFDARSSDALRWGDWNVSWRMHQNGPGDRYMDVTSAQGMPYDWFEFHGETPRLTLSAGASITDGHGKAVTFPFTGDRFQVDQDGHVFGVHAPPSTTFTRSGNVVTASAGTAYLVLSAVPAHGLTLDQLHEHAFAVPRDTTMDYEYDAKAGKVRQQWSVSTDLLQGTDHDTVQGWIQHQYADSTNNLAFTGATYQTPRGTMKTTIGHDGWDLDYDFSGITPIGATPEGTDVGEFKAKMHKYLADYAGVKWTGGDTYWDGKVVLQLAEYMTVAKQLGDTEDQEQLQTTLEGALSDWYTYTKGEKENFFARYPTWKALIGFADSYGSAQFNDNHFHYGYFATATALLGAVDPTWIKRYEGMARLVTQEYANSDRSDGAFPYLRTYGVWEGHSNAGGVSGPEGNNQESSSEAIQSEAGLFLLGTVLGDERMQATGAMEYVTERAAVRAYYQNVRGNPDSKLAADPDPAFPAEYQHAQVGILQDQGNAYATYFSADPAWIYGIQWMPTAPWFDYFGWDERFSQSIMQRMMSERPKAIGAGIADANRDRIQMFTKKWYGIGTYGDKSIAKDRTAAIGELQDAVRAVERNRPGYLASTSKDNLFRDYVSVEKGKVVFPAQYWTPTTLPASLVPAELTAKDVDEKPDKWSVPSPLTPFLWTGYTPDADTLKQLYSVDLTHYTPGTDTAHAAAVISDMGDALGQVVLGYLAQYDPATYQDIHDALWTAKDPAVTGKSMAGMVYYQGMSNRTVGTEVTTRHTSDPLSQVFKDDDGEYSYVLDNVDAVQHTYDVFDGTTVIGHVSVPAHTQITSHLDAHLERVEVAADGDPKTIVPGSTTAFTATGYDQYGATIPLDDVTWSATAGTVSADGHYRATTRSDAVTVTATVHGVAGSARFRVAPAPVLATIAVTPGFQQLVVGKPQQFRAAGRDQYGDAATLPGAVTWSYTGPGSVSTDGVVTTTAPGAGHVVATSGTTEGSAVASSVVPSADLARGAAVVASSTLAPNSAAKAVDGDDSQNSRWESKHGVDPVDFTVDLGRQTDVSGVSIVWEAAAAAQYDLQVADDADGPWRTVRHVTKTTAAADHLDVSATGRYVRMHGTARLSDYGYSILGFHVTGTPAESAITPTAVLVGPRSTAVLPGATADLTAYAFDASGAGGPVTPAGSTGAASWSVTGGGSVAQDGTVTAAGDAGVTSTVSAEVGAVSATATVTTLGTAASEPEPGRASRDVALGKPATASSAQRGDLAAGAAVDGDGHSRWSSAAADGEWIAVDLGAVLPLDAVEIDWEDAYADSYALQVRDTATDAWRTVADERAGSGGTERHDLTDVHGRYVRMLGGHRHTVHGYSLWALRVFSQQGEPTPDLAHGAVATSSSDESRSVPASNVTDGDDTTRWASGHSDDQWIDLDLGAVHAVHTATLHWEGAYATAYRVQGRATADGPWTTITTVTDGDGGTDDVALSGDWRWLRVQGDHRSSPYGYSLYGVQVR
jgi:endoglucanase Acf2